MTFLFSCTRDSDPPCACMRQRRLRRKRFQYHRIHESRYSINSRTIRARVSSMLRPVSIKTRSPGLCRPFPSEYVFDILRRLCYAFRLRPDIPKGP